MVIINDDIKLRLSGGISKPDLSCSLYGIAKPPQYVEETNYCFPHPSNHNIEINENEKNENEKNENKIVSNELTLINSFEKDNNDIVFYGHVSSYEPDNLEDLRKIDLKGEFNNNKNKTKSKRKILNSIRRIKIKCLVIILKHTKKQ